MQTNGVCQKIILIFFFFFFFVNNKPLKYREKIKELLPFTTRLLCVFVMSCHLLMFNFCFILFIINGTIYRREIAWLVELCNYVSQ